MTPNITMNVTLSTPEAAIAFIRAVASNMPGEAEQINKSLPPAAAAVAAAVNAAVPYVEAPTSVPAPAVNPTQAAAAPPVPMTHVPSIPTAFVTPPTQQMPGGPSNTVPTSAPVYTFDDLARAAGPLMDAGKTADLQALLRSFNVQALTQLPKEQYGAFATALRGLGARI